MQIPVRAAFAVLVLVVLAVGSLSLARDRHPDGSDRATAAPHESLAPASPRDGQTPAPARARDRGEARERVGPRLRGLAGPRRADRPKPARIRWRRSTAVGVQAGGRLVNGVRLPAEGRDYFTWDPIERRSPNRSWRRWGTDRLIRLVLHVAREHRRAHPRSPRVAIGDLSRPRGGDFGPQFGFVGHASHQNGLDVDVYYPRADRRERAPRDERDIDRRLSQALVDRFVAHGVQVVFVGPNTGLRGPSGVVQPLIQHDNHLHGRLPLP